MSHINTSIPTSQPSYPGTPSAASGSAPAAATPPVRREISAAQVDALTMEALVQSSANPASALEAPPPASAESTAAAGTTFTTIDVASATMSIEALIDLMNREILRQAGLNQKMSKINRQAHYNAAETKLIASAQRDKDAADLAVTKAFAGLAVGVAGGVMAGYSASKVDGAAGKGGWTMAKAWNDAGAGVVNAEFDKDIAAINAESKMLAASATSSQKAAETTATDGVQTATDQIRSAQDAIAKNEQARSDSRKSINRL